MRRVKKSRLPKWILPMLLKGSEEKIMGCFITPIILLVIFYLDSFWDSLPSSMASELYLLVIIVVIIILGIPVNWVMSQVILLKKARKELSLRYSITDDENEKVEIRESLAKLGVKLKQE